MISRESLLLGLDLGTTNIKAYIVTMDGTVVSSGSAAVGITYAADGTAEQNLEDIWGGTVTAIRKAVMFARGANVIAIGVSSQGGALQVLDRGGRCFGPVIGWQDSRGSSWDRELTARKGGGWFARHTGYPKSTSAVGQLLRLRAQGTLPQGFEVGWVGDVIVERLCGRRAHDGTSLSEACLFNPGENREDGELLEILGVERKCLPDLLSVNETAGGLLPDIAQSLSLPAGIPVGPAVHDQYSAALGSGVVRSGDTMLGAGTTWALLAITPELQLPVGGIALVGCHPVAGLFGQMLSMANGGACIAWGTRTLNLEAMGVQGTDSCLSSVRPGSDGLRFRPLLSEIGGAGLPSSAAGCLDGLRLGHTPAHILRALVEGLACELGRYLAMMREGEVPVNRLVMSGGAAASSVTPGIIADTTGLPVDCMTMPETSSIGAAILAHALVEPTARLVDLADSMKPPARRIEPGQGQPEAHARLEEYLLSCKALKAQP